MTKKRTPTYPLQEIKRLIREEKLISPDLKVIKSTNNMCLTISQAYQEVLNLEKGDFYQSITEFQNYKVWQDVYKKKIKGMYVYIKFKKVNDGFLLTSFKLDESQ